MTEIKVAKKEDLEKIAVCHRAAFPGSLSSALGLEYVKVMLGWYLSSENTFMFYVESEGSCIGYCGAMIRKTAGVGSASSMAQYSFDQALRSFLVRPWLVLHRELREKYLFVGKNLLTRMQRLIKGKQKNVTSEFIIFDPYVALVVIGVSVNEQGKGYGSQLLQEFETVSKEMGFHKLTLTVKSENAKAIKSYQRNGWHIASNDGKSIAMNKDI